MDDVLVSKHPGGLASLPHGGTVATGSVRRKHQLLWKRADLDLIDLRGNVPTRLRKLAENDWDAIVLACAGLERLGLSPARTKISFEGRQFFVETLPREIFLPAGGQGIIALQVRADDQSTKALVDLINNPETLLCLKAEREFLRLLQGDCNCPVGVLATIDNGKMKMRAQFFSGESPAPREAEVEGAADEGETLASELLRKIEQE
jgi:hydroxymethylbilane synthase